MVFVTSAVFPGDLAGVAGADQKCQNAARNSGNDALSGRRFIAWVSTAETGSSPSERFEKRDASYVLPDNGRTPVAAGWSGLVSTSSDLQHEINVTEDGGGVTDAGQVWTGTSRFGAPELPHCSGWTTADASVSGLTGTVAVTSARWTSFAGDACDAPHRLYCFEQ